MSKYLNIVFLLAFAEARFSQEQVPVSAVSSLSSFGQSGQAASLAGAVPGVLLAAANPCAKASLFTRKILILYFILTSPSSPWLTRLSPLSATTLL